MSSAQGLSRIACEHTSSGELCPQLVAWGNLHCAHRACAACSVQLLLSTPQRHPKIPRPPRDNSSCTASLRSTFRTGEFLTLLQRPFGADVSLPILQRPFGANVSCLSFSDLWGRRVPAWRVRVLHAHATAACLLLSTPLGLPKNPPGPPRDNSRRTAIFPAFERCVFRPLLLCASLPDMRVQRAHGVPHLFASVTTGLSQV